MTKLDPTVSLGEVCALIVDSEHKTAPKDPNGSYPLVRTTDLGRARANFTQAQRVNGEIRSRWTKRAVPAEGDLILAREAPVGGVVSIPKGIEPVLGQRTVLLRPDPEEVDGRFLAYRLAASDLQALMNEMSTGSTVPHLNMSDIRRFPLGALPVRTTQERIANLLSGFDELIEINERRIELLEDLARSLYREWFVHLRFPGSSASSRVDRGDGRLPEGWGRLSLSEVVTTQYGYTASATDDPRGPHYLRGMDINKRSYIDWSQIPYCEIDGGGFAKFRLEPGDVCVIRMADPGKVGIVERRIEAVFASYLVRLRSEDPRVGPYLLFYFLDSPDYQDWIRNSSTGSTRKSASATVLTEPSINVPTQELADLFDQKVSSVRKEMNILVEQNARLASVRDLLLLRLVTGKLDISDIDLGVLEPEGVA